MRLRVLNACLERMAKLATTPVKGLSRRVRDRGIEMVNHSFLPRLQLSNRLSKLLIGGSCGGVGMGVLMATPTLPPPFGTQLDSFHKWVQKQSPAVLQIITINTGVFLLWRVPALQTMMYRNFTCSFASLASGRLYTTVTSVFSHQGFFHFAFNMYALTSFAPVLVDVMGHNLFLQFYIGSGILSSFASCLLQGVQYSVRRSSHILSRPGLGASGAVFAMLAVWAKLFPELRLHIIFAPFISFKAGDLLPALVTFDVAGCLYGFIGNSPLGHGAHLGGLACGYWMFDYLSKHNKKVIWWNRAGHGRRQR